MFIDFEFKFSGGQAHAMVQVVHHGEIIHENTFNNSGVKSINLEPGKYQILVTGISPSNDTEFRINHPTKPQTPIRFPEGPFSMVFDLDTDDTGPM